MIPKPQYEVAHIIEKNWEKIIQNSHFNSHQIRMLNALRVCRTVALGWHIDQCNDCSHLRISYNSCRNRHCPKCQGSQREAWISAQHKKLLPVKYFHVVFTIPDALNRLCLYQSKMMYSILFKAAWHTIKTFAADPKHLGAATGMTSILHTWGQNLSLHPHLHCIIPAGGIAKSENWKQTKSKGKFLFPVKAMSPVFRAEFVSLLRKEAKRKRANIPQEVFDKCFKKSWIVFAKQPFLGPSQIIEYIGRYTHKIAISNHRITKIEQGKVHFQYKDYRKSGKKLSMTLDEMEFIRRFSLHILPLRFVRIRHFGILNPKSKHKQEDLIQAIHENGEVEKLKVLKLPVLAPKKNTAVACPVCKKGKMHIITFGRGPPPDLVSFKNLEYNKENSVF